MSERDSSGLPAPFDLHGLNPADLFARAILACPHGDGSLAEAPSAPARAVGAFPLRLSGAVLLLAAITAIVFYPAAARWGKPRVASAAPNTAAGAAGAAGANPQSGETEMRLLETAAENGDISAQYRLGNKYRDGKDAPCDMAKAAGWYRKAAENGSAEADVELGVMYSNAIVSVQPVDWARVAAAWERESEAGNDQSQRRLGECYRNARGVPHDPEKAVYWLQKSAEQENVVALFSLGQMYYGNRGLPRDDAKAFYWVEKAARKGYGMAEIDLSRMHTAGIGTTKNPAEAFSWAKSAAEKGFPTAQVTLAKMYFEGTGVPKNVDSAILWCRKAAQQGNGVAQQMLDQILSGSNQTSSPDIKGFTELLRLAESGNAAAQLEVGSYYMMGKGVGQKGFEWIKKAAENGHAESQTALADIYAAGIFTPKDDAKAAEWRAIARKQKQNLPAVPGFDPQHPQFYDAE